MKILTQLNFFRKPPNNTDDFQSVGDFVRKEQQLTVQLESEQLWSSLENTDGFCPSVIPFVIDIMNSVNKVTNGFTDGIYSVGNSVGKS